MTLKEENVKNYLLYALFTIIDAGVAELGDARDLKSLGTVYRAGSIPALGAIFRIIIFFILLYPYLWTYV